MKVPPLTDETPLTFQRAALEPEVIRDHPAERLTAENLRRMHGQWQEAPPMPPDVKAHCWANTRIRWNAYTSAIEGFNTDYQSTSELLLRGRVRKDTRLEDIDAVRGHDAALAQLRDGINQKRSLTEEGLLALHGVLLIAAYRARDPNGYVLNYFVTPGAYKSRPNIVRTPQQIIEFAPPEEVPDRMRAFVSRWNRRLDIALQDPFHFDPALLWAECHLEFINIHPFDDGNERMARLIANYLAMRMGYPPMVITLEQREAYFSALQAMQLALQDGDIQPLRDLHASCMVTALDFAIAVARGQCDPTADNEHADPRKPNRKAYPYAYPIDLSTPVLRPQDR